MGNLSQYMAGGGAQSGAVQGDSPAGTPDHPSADGYASEDFVAGSSSNRERKKGLVFVFFIFIFFLFFFCREIF